MDFSHKQYDKKSCYEVQIGKVHIGFSYHTPVCLHDRNPNGKTLNTKEFFSNTTNRHLRLLMGPRAETVPQAELERQIELALAHQALSALKERLTNGRTSISTTDQSAGWIGDRSAVFWESGAAVEIG